MMKVRFFCRGGGPLPECGKGVFGRPRIPPLWYRVAAAVVNVAAADGG